jgi:hypothetical protein
MTARFLESTKYAVIDAVNHVRLAIPFLIQEPVQVISVGAVCDRAIFLESRKYARS